MITGNSEEVKRVTKPQAVIRPLTTGYIKGEADLVNVTKPQAVIWPFTLWLAHGSQSGLKALQWTIETLFIAKTADLLTTAVFFRLCKNENALGARLAGIWQMICLL